MKVWRVYRLTLVSEHDEEAEAFSEAGPGDYIAGPPGDSGIAFLTDGGSDVLPELVKESIRIAEGGTPEMDCDPFDGTPLHE